MKKTLLNQAAKVAIIGRIEQLKPSLSAKWGRMSVAQMVCHCGDQFKLASGEIPVAGKPSFLGRTLMRWVVFMGMPAPKGKVKTYQEIDQVANHGTPPTEFAADVKALKLQIETFIARGEDYNWRAHPTFGKMNQRQWAKLAYSHLDHHLRQFGA